MGNYTLNRKKAEIHTIKLNTKGDKMFISSRDAGLWNRFLEGYKKFSALESEVSSKLEEEKKNQGTEDSTDEAESAERVLEIRGEFCQKMAEITDGIFGEGTVKKFFREEYECIPDFLPDEYEISSFYDTMIPIMEDIFKNKIEEDRKASKARMEKYRPAEEVETK